MPRVLGLKEENFILKISRVNFYISNNGKIASDVKLPVWHSFASSSINSKTDSFEKNTAKIEENKELQLHQTEMQVLLNKANTARKFKKVKSYCYEAIAKDRNFKKSNPEYFVDYRPYSVLAKFYLKYGYTDAAIDNYNNAIDILSNDILNSEKLSLTQFKKQNDARKKQDAKDYEQALKEYNETFFAIRIFKQKPDKSDYDNARKLLEANSRQFRKILELSNMFNSLALSYYQSENNSKKAQNYAQASKDIRNYSATADEIISMRARGIRDLSPIYGVVI